MGLPVKILDKREHVLGGGIDGGGVNFGFMPSVLSTRDRKPRDTSAFFSTTHISIRFRCNSTRSKNEYKPFAGLIRPQEHSEQMCASVLYMYKP